MTDNTYENESPHDHHTRHRDARLVGHEAKADTSKEAVEEIIDALDRITGKEIDVEVRAARNMIVALLAERDTLRKDVGEARRRRDAWKAKAEDYDTIRYALREKVGAPWPPNLSRSLWAALAADEKKRADDAEAELEGTHAIIAAERAEVLKLRKENKLLNEKMKNSYDQR